MTLAMLLAVTAPGVGGTVVFGLPWLHELRARHAAEAERDRLWDEAHSEPTP